MAVLSSAFLLFILSSVANAQVPEERLSQLNHYILQEQRLTDADPRSVGTWRSTLDITLFGVRVAHFDHSDSFDSLQVLNLLREIEAYYPVSGLDTAEARFLDQLNQFHNDSQKTYEPPGSISYWPLRKKGDGTWVRVFGLNFFTDRFKPLSRIANIPNDMDSSTQAFIWYGRKNLNVQFQADYLNLLRSRAIDQGRSVQHKSSLQWVPLNSGGFLTWMEADAVDQPTSRIASGFNDVDPVLNLNILEALGRQAKLAGGLDETLLQRQQVVCRLINSAVAKGRVPGASLYYDRPSQFLLAYSKAWKAGVACLSPSGPRMVERVREEIIRASKGENFLEIAELTVALKTLTASEDRNTRDEGLLNRALRSLDDGLEVDDPMQVAEPRSRDSVTVMNFGKGLKSNIYYPSLTAAMILFAIVMP